MTTCILHVLDSTTPADAVESLGLLLRAAEPHTHQVSVLGHRSTQYLLTATGIGVSSAPHEAAPTPVHWLRSMGWADPTGWRALGHLVKRIAPSHLHAWGMPAALAAAMTATTAQRIVTPGGLPSTVRRLVFRTIERGCGKGGGSRPRPPVQWLALTNRIKRELSAEGVPADRLTLIRPGITAKSTDPHDRTRLRDALGLSDADRPLLLLGGEGGESRRGDGSSERARHDYGLWVTGILQTIFPKIRVIVREDSRHRQDHGLERLLNDLADGDVPVLASADYSWDQLLSLADVLLVSADGPVSMGSAWHAQALGVPVVGAPVEAVEEYIEDERNGLIVREIKPRAQAARVEELLADPALRARIVAGGRADAAQHTAASMVAAFNKIYSRESVFA